MPSRQRHGSTETSEGSRQPNAHLTDSALALLRASLSDSTKSSYKHSWLALLQFCNNSNNSLQLPVSEITLCNFIAHLFEKHYSPSSIASMLSAISYIHKILGLCDNSQTFLVRKILQGANKSASYPDSRLPITLPILSRITNALDKTISEHFNRSLLCSIFTLALHGFFRMGELIAKKPAFLTKVVQREDVSFPEAGCVQVIIRYSKTMQNVHPITLFISGTNSSYTCPVQSLRAYLSSHIHFSGPLFQFASGVPVSQHFVSSHLQKAITFIGLSPKLYKSHSFRIGAATEATKRGLSQTEIQKLGRWKSDAFQKYIRISSFKV
ncbi:hypothetical protein FSP39_017027 [Pinctada imbricata]|uniref:Tyr recombinase domain-containing protein n=1 Tax=Pinctada imbricata TaxID=66713 RepID=A0AA88YLX7_PINIB|nr:hypothetical protein FSP39_017027 [Pinctada imbricata]